MTSSSLSCAMQIMQAAPGSEPQPENVQDVAEAAAEAVPTLKAADAPKLAPEVQQLSPDAESALS